MSQGAYEDKDQAVERLYTLPFDQFTAARNELAKSLREAGRKAEAEEVRRLQRPSIGAWALNQLARKHPKELRALIQAGQRLRKVQASGKGDLRAATQAERSAVADLLREARSILSESGRKPTEAALQPVRATLAAAAADADAAVQLQKGRLARELEAPDFGGLLAQVSRRGPVRQKAAPRRPAADQRKAVKRELEEARARLSEARRIAGEADRNAERLRREAERAQQDAEAALSGVEDAEASVEAVERRLGALDSSGAG